jgi:hypothetical protein
MGFRTFDVVLVGAYNFDPKALFSFRNSPPVLAKVLVSEKISTADSGGREAQES